MVDAYRLHVSRLSQFLLSATLRPPKNSRLSVREGPSSKGLSPQRAGKLDAPNHSVRYRFVGGPITTATDTLSLLSFNIQVGIETECFRHYLTKSWRHLLPDTRRTQTLTSLSQTLADFDVVALQECDAGSLRSGYLNQVQFLAQRAAFPYAVTNRTRDWFPLAQHCNGLLSRRKPIALEEHRLPGRLPGRAALSARIPFADANILLVVLHLSLGVRSRQRQLSYIAQLIAGERYAVLIGDLNTSVDELMSSPELASAGLTPLTDTPATYPAWRPTRAIDHIVGTRNLKIENYRALEQHASDHRPVAAQVCPR
jgi:endonuclease/exonuclease/phosphatase family metal-dependent hydrolase